MSCLDDPISVQEIPTISDTSIDSIEDNDMSNVTTEASQPLFAGSNVSLRNTVLAIEGLSSRYNLSDEATGAIYRLLRCVLPKDNKLPSGITKVRHTKKRFVEQTRCLKRTSNGEFCVLNFARSLKSVVSNNFTQILKYSSQRRGTRGVYDISLTKAPPVIEPVTRDVIPLHLILSTDGASIVKSSSKQELWPVWLQAGFPM